MSKVGMQEFRDEKKDCDVIRVDRVKKYGKRYRQMSLVVSEKCKKGNPVSIPAPSRYLKYRRSPRNECTSRYLSKVSTYISRQCSGKALALVSHTPTEGFIRRIIFRH